MTAETLSETIQQSKGKLAIMVHGACMNDLQWNRKEHDHGAALARDLGFEPLYVHYNTGLHISENGQSFASLLETIAAQSPEPVELFIVAHSMGGLVTRSACHYAKKSGHTWLQNLRKVVFLGTPHHGSLLERGGNCIDVLLKMTPYSAPFSRLGKIRSCGVTDLRYGNLLDDDWQGGDRFESSGDQRIPVPLPKGVQCYAIAATTGKESSTLSDNVIGDGLVTLRSALGRHDDVNLDLPFPENNQWIVRNVNHLDLLSNPSVYKTIKTWLHTKDIRPDTSISPYPSV
jgi:pimeloyl-ACP methyl ester carboxylesterase